VYLMGSCVQVKRISLSKNILRVLEVNTDIPPLSEYPRSHQVCHSFYFPVGSFEIGLGHVSLLFGHATFPKRGICDGVSFLTSKCHPTREHGLSRLSRS
jgi:hypothetical protein